MFSVFSNENQTKKERNFFEKFNRKKHCVFLHSFIHSFICKSIFFHFIQTIIIIIIIINDASATNVKIEFFIIDKLEMKIFSN